jgi:uncharacterized protein
MRGRCENARAFAASRLARRASVRYTIDVAIFEFHQSMRCPTCKSVHRPAAGSQLGPFCSSRCQLIDLGRWLGEEYRVPDATPVAEGDLEAAQLDRDLARRS